MVGALRWSVCAFIAGIGLGMAAGSAAASDKVDFSKVQPILKQSCVKCHSLDNPRKKAAGGLRLDNKDEALKGGKSGKDIVPGHAEDSLMYKLLLGPVNHDGEDIDPMPKSRRGEQFKPLPKDKIEVIKSWIDAGAA
jgi:hypothetical protein